MTDISHASAMSSSVASLHRPRSNSSVPRDFVHCPPSEYQLVYYGNVVLDRRITQPMLPWIVDEKRGNHGAGHPVVLQISPRGVLGISSRQGSVLFEHQLHNISRFSRGHNQQSFGFGYLWRPDSNSNFRCFVFRANDNEEVQNVVSTIRDIDKKTTPQSTTVEAKQAMEEIKELNSNMFEVMYCGKISLNDKRAPPSFIDEAIGKFREHEIGIERRKRHFSSDDRVRSASDGADRRSGSLDIVQEDGSKSLSHLDISCRIPNTQNNNSNDATISSDSGSPLSNIPVSRNQHEVETTTGRQFGTLPRADAYTKLLTLRENSQNRTMVFQIGRNVLTIIGLDKRSHILTKKFSEISFCSQGIKQPEYFGFICREKSSNQNYMCYVFKCQNESVVDCIMTTLRQAFNAALHHNKLHVICETCPMHQLHKLCLQVEGQSEEELRQCLEHQIESFGVSPSNVLTPQMKKFGENSTQEYNQAAMMFLMRLYEQQQQNHTHISDANNQTTQKSDSIRAANSNFESLKKAKKSLASSFENLLLRNKNRSSTDRTRMETGAGEKGVDKEQSVEDYPRESSCSTASSASPHRRSSSPLSTTSDDAEPLDITERGKPPPHPSCPKKQVSEDTGPTSSESLPMRQRSKTLGDVPMTPPTPSTPAHKEKSVFQFEGDRFNTSIKPARRKPPLIRAMSVGGRSHLSPGGSPRTPLMTSGHRKSWRQAIYNRVVTPISESKAPTFAEGDESIFLEAEDEAVSKCMSSPVVKQKRFTSKLAIRALWQRAIREQILLNRMDKENKIIQARQEAVIEKKMKLDYEEITPCLKEACKQWDKLIALPDRANKLIPYDDINILFKEGVPRSRRGDIWKILSEQRLLRLSPGSSLIPVSKTYRELLTQLTTHQHAILIDLGRTYPSHPYFCNPLGRGQLSLFNLLKAYSLLDDEVGYCQGLSFVAGILLMHLEEEDAFQMLKYLMFSLGFRRQYKPDMTALQIQMYQLSRLLHDFHLPLHDHLEANEVAPSLYAAPWFLTLFASQFPLGFVSKVFDLILLQGFEVIFKVAVVILGSHEELILQCDGFESIIDFIKNQLPSLGVVQMEKVVNKAYNLDISRQLHAYEVEYHVIQEEMLPSPPHSKSFQHDIDRLDAANHNLRRHNSELLEQLQSAHNVIDLQRTSLQTKQEAENQLQSELRTLKLEREALLDTINKLRALIPDNILHTADIGPMYLAIPMHNTCAGNSSKPVHGGTDDTGRDSNSRADNLSIDEDSIEVTSITKVQDRWSRKNSSGSLGSELSASTIASDADFQGQC